MNERLERISRAVRSVASLMIFLHVCMFILGIVMIAFKFNLRKTKWFTVFHDTTLESDADGILTGMVIVGAVTIPFAMFGFFVMLGDGFFCRTYSLLATGMFAAFMTLAVWSLHIASTTSGWKGDDFLRYDPDELALGRQFNKLYCHAQTAYFCNKASLNTILATDFGSVILANSTAFKVNTTESQSCLARYGLDSSDAPVSFGQMCAYCVDSASKMNYANVTKWVNKRCAFDESTLTWCEGSDSGLVYLNGGYATVEAATEFQGSPYEYCRDDLLGFLQKWGIVGGVVVLVVCLLLVISVVYLVSLNRVTKVEEGERLASTTSFVEMQETAPVPESEATVASVDTVDKPSDSSSNPR